MKAKIVGFADETRTNTNTGEVIQQYRIHYEKPFKDSKMQFGRETEKALVKMSDFPSFCGRLIQLGNDCFDKTIDISKNVRYFGEKTYSYVEEIKFVEDDKTA